MKASLSARLRSIAAAAAASSSALVGSYGCGSGAAATDAPVGARGVDAGTDADAGTVFDQEASFACEDPLPGIAAGLRPSVPVDYVAILHQLTFEDVDAGEPQPAARVNSEHGTACATASDRDICLAALEAAKVGQYPQAWPLAGDPIGPPNSGEPRELVVYTRGDQVGTVVSTGSVAAFLGEIDTVEEARLLLQTTEHRLRCTTTPARSGWRQAADGTFEVLVAGRGCGGGIKYRYHHRVTRSGAIETTVDPTVGPPAGPSTCGRRPAGLVASLATGEDLAAHFARCAHLEAASVVAFRRLETELRRHGAPHRLIERARRARADEIRHARDTASVARRLGADVEPVVMARAGRRSLYEIALENAVEGCVRETYGALVAWFQAERAAPELRPLLRGIAADEARHAELAHDVALWIERRLTAAERIALSEGRRRALEELRQEVATDPPEALVRGAGLPRAQDARVLLDGLAGEVLTCAA